jgi:translocation and assembly module TamA
MRRLSVTLLIGIALGAASFSSAVRADWFFGLFGSSEEPPAPSADAVSYAVEIVAPDDSLNAILQSASNLYKLRQQPPQNGEGLARRASADLPRLVDALWAEGYYDASATASIDGHTIRMGGAGIESAARAADADINRRVAQVRLDVAFGALYRIGAIKIVEAGTGEAVDDAQIVRPHVLRLAVGDPARANAIRDMLARLTDALRAQSYPLAKVELGEAVVHHPQETVDLLVKVNRGRKAGFGEITVAGTRHLDPAVVRSFIYVEEGDPYSPERIAAMRKSIGQIEAIGSTRILESDHLDANGNLPVTVQVDERKQFAISGAAQYSTIDGPSARAEWVDRNVFGGGERLRLDAAVGYAQQATYETNKEKGWFDPNRMIGRLNANFIKPALGGTRFDYLADVTLAREVTTSYQAEYFNVSQFIRYRFDETLSVQGGWEIERGQSQDSFGNTNYFLSGFVAGARYDTTDNLLDPHRGVRVIASGGAYPEFFGSTINFYQGRAQASTYYSIDEESRYILAGRIGLGASGGAEILAIPDNRRFFAGGGGSVRGYAWRSLSPYGANNEPMGGLSLFEASVEARVKITDEIGVVPFIDAGNAYATAFPDFQQPLRYGVGLGLRYYTGFGPIRLDVAAPLERLPGEAVWALYIGIGQAF